MASVRLRNGERLSVRPLGAGDGELLHRLFHGLSAATVYRRFMSPLPHPTAVMTRALLDVDHHDREALAAVVDGEVIGVARYTRDLHCGDSAEIAIVIEDAWQRRGLGWALFNRLAAVARRRGIRVFRAQMLGDNRPAARLLLSYSRATRFEVIAGQMEAELPIRRFSAPA